MMHMVRLWGWTKILAQESGFVKGFRFSQDSRRQTDEVGTEISFTTKAHPTNMMPPAVAAPTTRTRALSLYRQLLRAAEKMPTPNRRKFVVKKTRTEFKANKHLTDAEEIKFCLRLADTNLDTVMLQAEHLTNLMKDPNYHADI